jgi:putative membrane protein
MAGALLLLPGLVDLVVMTPLFFLWLAQIEQKQRIADQRRQEQAEAQAVEEGVEQTAWQAEQ